MRLPKRKFTNKYLRFSSIGIQMGGIIGGMTWLGVYLDERNHTGNTWTLILALSGVAGSMYLVIKEVIEMSKEE